MTNGTIVCPRCGLTLRHIHDAEHIHAPSITITSVPEPRWLLEEPVSVAELPPELSTIEQYYPLPEVSLRAIHYWPQARAPPAVLLMGAALKIFERIVDWWRAHQRKVDLTVLWPTCCTMAGNIEDARVVFYMHAHLDPAWRCLGNDRIVETILKLQWVDKVIF